MTEPVTASTAVPAGVVAALADLAAAYFERLANGDWARASVILSVFAETFNRHRDGVIAVARLNSARPDLSLIPARADVTFSMNTRRAMQVALVLGPVGTRIAPIVEAMPTVIERSVVSAWWGTLTDHLDNTTQSFIDAVAADSVRTLATNLSSRVNARIYGGPAETVRDLRETPFDTPTAMAPAPTAPTVGPTIYVGPSRWTMPTWGWWALGLGALAAGGVVFYGVTERGWFKEGR
jgi:hypothetical protein